MNYLRGLIIPLSLVFPHRFGAFGTEFDDVVPAPLTFDVDCETSSALAPRTLPYTLVFVAALGDAFSLSPSRGVFASIVWPVTVLLLRFGLFLLGPSEFRRRITVSHPAQ